MTACQNDEGNENSLALAKYLIDTCKANPKYASRTGTPLIYAIEAINLELVKYLVDGNHGIDVNHTDGNGMSAFYYSVYKGDRQIFNFLNSKQEADPFIRGTKKSNVIHICSERNFIDIAKSIIDKNPEKNTELIYQTTEIARDGQNEEESDEENAGATPLHIAIEWNQIEMIEYLVDLGGEKLIRIQNADGNDAIEFAYIEN